jgi:hypothetical protein
MKKTTHTYILLTTAFSMSLAQQIATVETHEQLTD